MTDPFCEGLRATIRDAIASHFDTYTDEELREFATESLNLLKRPTLADMAEEERRACQWMQADTETWGRVAIITPHLRWGSSALLDRRGDVAYEAHANITPRPDLPRLEWPGTEKPDPAPALPGGWKLADHEKRGRVIVTNDTPNTAGEVCFVLPATDPLGYDWLFCTPDELTYIDIDQEAGTADDVPPNTLAVGSEWGDSDALDRACRESGRDQITVIDCDGDVYVWDAGAEWWQTGFPTYGCEPFTILHAGKGGDQ